MARRRKGKSFARAKTRTVTRFKRVGGKVKKGLKGLMSDLPIMSFGYGLVRNDIAGIVSPLSSKLPFGDLNDEIAIGLSAYGLSKVMRGSSPIMKKIIDNEAFTAGMFTRQKVGNKGNVSGNSNGYVYG
jgi:hypothetical protein